MRMRVNETGALFQRLRDPSPIVVVRHHEAMFRPLNVAWILRNEISKDESPPDRTASDAKGGQRSVLWIDGMRRKQHRSQTIKPLPGEGEVQVIPRRISRS